MDCCFAAWLLLSLVALAGWIFRPAEPGVAVQLVGISQNESVAAFTRVCWGRAELVFPRDHGPHPDFQTEWWYYTGNLQADDGRRFGYQLTFFRRAVQPTSERPARLSNWAAEQIYLAHFTLTDVAGRAFYPFERFERGAAGLAGEPLVSQPTRSGCVIGRWSSWMKTTYHLRASEEGSCARSAPAGP
jgi:predicted secreted hydrolase